MGGPGSGRRSHSGGKRAAEDARPLDIRRLYRAGLLYSGSRFGWEWTIGGRPVSEIQITVVGEDHVTLHFQFKRHGEEWREVARIVYLDYTPCRYGGRRPWWLCQYCGRRAAVVYRCEDHYACRHCGGIVYASQREEAHDRALRKANKIRKRLGWRPGIAHGRGAKPKGMHWKTYQRLYAEYDEIVGRVVAHLASS